MTAARFPDDPFARADAPTPGSLAALLNRPFRCGRFVRGDCPLCGRRGAASLNVSDGGRVWGRCFGCGEQDGLLAVLGLGGKRLPPSSRPPQPRQDRPRAPDMVADAAQLDAVYAIFAKHMAMSADDRRRHLTRDRGIPAEIRDRMPALLAPLPREANARAWVSRRLVEALKGAAPMELLNRLPELSLRRGAGFTVLYGRDEARYFEPWCDEDGRVVALRAYMGKRPDGRKYLTSPGRWGPLIHVAYGVPRELAATVPWILTEGWLKAEVAAHHLGCVAIGFPGIDQKSAWRRALDVKQRLAPDAPLYIAFDAEAWATRLEIGVIALELALEAGRTLGAPAGFAVWATHTGADGTVEPKGIDDAIVAGEPVHLIDRAAFGGFLAYLLEEVEVEIERHDRTAA